MHRAGVAIARRAATSARAIPRSRVAGGQYPLCAAFSSDGGENKKQQDAAPSGGFFGSLLNKLQETNPDLKESVEELKSSAAAGKAAEAASKFQAKKEKAKAAAKDAADNAAKAARATGERLDSSGAAREAFEKASESASEGANKARDSAREAADKAAGRAEATLGSKFMDVVAGVFGMRRARRDDSGVYPWIEWQDPDSGKFMYKNVHANVITDVKPADFDEQMELAEAEGRLDQHRINMDASTSALSIMPEHKSRFDTYSDRLMQQPVMQSLMRAVDDVRESEIGHRAAEVRERVTERKEVLQEKWETSQHPLVYNASYAVDAMFSESEQGRGMREMLLIDKGFDEAEFLDEMSHAIIPQVVDAFLRGDRAALRAWCTEEALEPLNAVLKARESEKITVDPTILAISKVDFAGMRPAIKGSPPLAVVTSMVQQIHCMKKADGTVVEGGDNEVRAVFYFFAMQREWSPVGLTWRVAEMSMAGSLLYL